MWLSIMVIDATADCNAADPPREIIEVGGGGVRSFGAEGGPTFNEDADDARDCTSDSRREFNLLDTLVPLLIPTILEVVFRALVFGVRDGADGEGSSVILRQLLIE